MILTSSRKEYLYKLSDLSENSHTGEYLADQIKEVINSIGSNKFSAIVSDNARNVKKARELINKEFPSIQDVRCVAHFVNLLACDIVEHNFADNLLKRVNILVTFFKKVAMSGNN